MLADCGHIVVVDDDPSLRQMVVKFLEDNNVPTKAASSRAEFNRLFAGPPPSLIILDLRLGQDDGLDLLREIRSHSDVPVIITTGHRPDEIDRIVGLELGADDYIVKPFSLRELLARVRAVLRRHPDRDLVRDVEDFVESLHRDRLLSQQFRDELKVCVVDGQPLIPRPGGWLLAGQLGEALLKTVRVVAARLKDVRQGSLGRATNFRHVHVEQPAVALAEATGDHDRVHLSALGRVDNGADSIVGGEQADVVGPDHDQVRLLAWRERTDTVMQSGAAGPVDRRGFKDVLNRRRSRSAFIAGITAVLREGALQREGNAHLCEHVAAIGGFEVRPDPRLQAVVRRRLPGEDAAG